MSHFTSIKTRLVSKEHLLTALRELGYQPEEGLVAIQGYAGQRTAVDIRIPTKNPEYDIGFRQVGEAYECVGDWEYLKIKPQAFIDKVSQRYAYHATKDTLAKQGFQIASETTEKDGQIRLVLRRMS